MNISNGVQCNDYHRIILDNITEGLQVAQILYDDKGVPNDYMFLDVNSVCAEIMGLSKEEIIGRKVTDFYPDAEPEWFIKYGEIIKSGKSEIFEIWNETSDTWHEVLAVPLGEDKFAITDTDVTKCKKMEDEFRKSKDDIQIERDKLDVLIRNMPDEVWFTNEHGNIILTNQTIHGKFGTNYLGLNVAEIAAKLDVYYPDGTRRSAEDTPLLLAIKGEKVLNGEEIIRLPVNKELRHRWFNVVPVRDTEDKIIGAVAVTRDITEQKQGEKELHQSQQKALALVSELEKINKNKDEFINILSHELRNPLATITGGIALLKHANKNKKTINTIRILERQTEYLSKLVDDLLDITRISQKKILMKKELVNLNTIIKYAIEDIKPQFDEKSIKLLENISTEPTIMNVDSLRITECISNILRNALKFTGENGTVSISLQKEWENAVISIEDNGIGINPEMLSTIFEPFKQDFNPLIKHHNKGMGIGLGLSIVKEYVELHNGHISASSLGVGKGSTFTIRLPIIDK